ncbi:MAG: ribosome small subunit-dependent GTPase A [Oscillospiraceae bacterium]|jgi:ribosome biogenesis GTPase|nr:ribosome small subunit-dependent GTPase A [Oscillospiraceae bacterium]
MNEGIIYKAMSGFYYVKLAKETVECRARGRFRLEKNIPLVGDYVTFTPTEAGKGILTTIKPRKNSFKRPPLANIDKLVIIASNAIPVTDTYIIDWMTVIAESNECEPIICINKVDLDIAAELYDIYTSSGFTVVRTSAKTGEGIDDLVKFINGSVCAFTGNSGVGKSSILNAIDPNFKIAVGDISNKLGRGRHITRHVELYELSCGSIVADTPGFSSFDSGHFTKKENIQHLFRDFEPFWGMCRFHDCAHISEPECSVMDALATGKLQKSRYDNYVRLYENELEYKEWEYKK